MAAPFPGNPQFGGHESVQNKHSMDRSDGGRWYFSRKEIEESSTSKRDGIDLKKETYLRKSYCTFLQDLGMRLKVPQVTIATAIIFCHRFFLRQSHAKNDRRTIATVCMFLAGKVEETPRPLKDVILVSYEIINKKDSAAIQRIKQKEVYEQQKELILLGERVVLATLGFDLNVQHPYKPLVEAIKKFKVAQNALAQVAWNFVNDGLRTSLCLQFKPHHIAAGAIFLAAKFLKVKLPSDGDKVWWQEFDVTARQLEEVSNQMLELYEQNRVPPAQGSEIDGSATAANQGMPPGVLLSGDVSSSNFQIGAPRTGPTKPLSAQPILEPRAGPSNTAAEPRPEPELPTIDEHRTVGSNPEHEGMRMIDKDKVKAALRQRKMRGDVGRKLNLVDDEDDLIERELEEGIELANEGDRDSSLRNRSSVTESDHMHKAHHHVDVENAEEGELPASRGNVNHKRAGSPLERSHDHHGGSHSEWMDEKRKMSNISHTERDHNWLFQGHRD